MILALVERDYPNGRPGTRGRAGQVLQLCSHHRGPADERVERSRLGEEDGVIEDRRTTHSGGASWPRRPRTRGVFDRVADQL